MTPFSLGLTIESLSLLSIPLLAFVQFNSFLEPWESRKVLHMGTGTLFMLTNFGDDKTRWGLYAVVIINVFLLSLQPTYHFSSRRDVGITTYLLFCAFVAWYGVPFWKMAPLFYADPAGAIVGRNVETPKLVGSKSVGGTFAVFAVSVLTLFGASWSEAVFHGAVLAALELGCGKWDNPAMGTWLLLRAVT